MMQKIYLKVFLLSSALVILQSCTLFRAQQPGSAPNKFSNFTFQACPGEKEDAVHTSIRQDLREKGTVLHLLKFYSEEIRTEGTTGAPYFEKLQRIFDRGVTPQKMSGYYHGAVVAFRNQEFFGSRTINALNFVWPLARIFSPWTGKTFEDISPDKLMDITDGFETGNLPTAWGSNTYAADNIRQKMVVELMKALHMWMEPASREEIAANNYDTKGFFFIGHRAGSVNPANKGREIYQFNYRWPRLKTFPPDNYCIDEIVQIADGLYLGQLVYATDLSRPYDPKADPAQYRYYNFGYFLLMDKDWQELRSKIGFDVVK